LDALEIGDEAIIDTFGFSLDGRPMRTVRQAVNRARRAGYSTKLNLISDLPPAHIEALRGASAGWRPHSALDRGFSMALSRFGAVVDPDAVIVEGYSEDRQLVAVLQLVPWGTRGWSLDVMHRSPGCVNGVMEMMIADVVEAAHERGIRKISLNFALFRSALARGERIGAGPILRAWVRLLLFASRWWQIASLYRANAKLCPSWKPRFLCFASARDLGDVVFATMQAEGFLTLPWRPQTRRYQASAARTGAARCR
jgi:lysyl-tRNA synthetase class 2